MHQVLLLANWQFIAFLLLELNDPPLSSHQLVMFLKLLLPEELVVFRNFLHLQLQLLNGLLIFSWIAHFLGTIKQLLNVLLLVLQHFLLGLDLELRLVNLILLLLDDVLEIKHPLQGDLIGLLALVVSDCFLKPFDHLVGILQLHTLRLNRDWVSILDVVLFELIFGSLL